MNNKITQLANRRESLVAQIAVQRKALIQNIRPYLAPLTLLDRGLSILYFSRSRPALMIGAGVFLSLVRLIIRRTPARRRSGKSCIGSAD